MGKHFADALVLVVCYVLIPLDFVKELVTIGSFQ